SRLGRHAVLLGTRADGREERIEPYGVNVLVAGTSGSGKSTMTKGLLERLAEAGYQYAIIDPEGDYTAVEGAIVLGDPHRAPWVRRRTGRSGSSAGRSARSRRRWTRPPWSPARRWPGGGGPGRPRPGSGPRPRAPSTAGTRANMPREAWARTAASASGARRGS